MTSKEMFCCCVWGEMTAPEMEIIKHHIKREELQQQRPTKTNRMQLYKRLKSGFSVRVLESSFECLLSFCSAQTSFSDNNSSAMGQREAGPSPAVLDKPLSWCVCAGCCAFVR